jgi:hypothetical protein
VVADNLRPGLVEPDDGGTRDEDPLKLLIEQFGAFTSYTGHFAQAKVDVVRVRARHLFARALAVLVAVLVIAAAAITGTVYIVHGTALALTEAFGGRASLGYIVAGLVCAGGTIGVSVFGIWIGHARRRHETIDKYERRKSIERSLHGRDIDQAADEAA